MSFPIHVGDCREVLRAMPEASIDCVVTSPPYWGLRDYGVEGQLGMEATPDEYLAAMLEVFELVRRVLKPEGTLWLNMGDSYIANRGGGIGATSCAGSDRSMVAYRTAVARRRQDRVGCGLKHKDLVGMPWRLALALQADGWWLRSDIIWHKPNPMPESVRDRPVKSHEYMFLLSQSARYYYDADAVKQPVSGTANPRGNGVNPKAKIPSGWDTSDGDHHGKTGRYRNKQNESFSRAVSGLVETRHLRTVWSITTQAFAGAHFATMPEALVEPCIKAGCPPGGVVLDPFAGSGTVLRVAQRLGRHPIGIELNTEYAELAQTRSIGGVQGALPMSGDSASTKSS